MVTNYYRYWAKTDKVDKTRCHLVPYHLLDVASVTQCFLSRDITLKRLFDVFGIPPKLALKIIPFFAALHDLGKYLWQFQKKSLPLAQHLNPKQIYSPKGEIHTDGSLVLLLSLFRIQSEPLALQSQKQILLNAFAGHHGTPVWEAVTFETQAWVDAQTLADVTALFHDLQELFQVSDQELDSWWGLACPQAESLSFILNGLVTVADWFGSDSEVFTLCDDIVPLPQYYTEKALPRANTVLDGTLICTPKLAEVEARDLFPFEAFTPLQEWALTVPIHPAGGLYILEDSTGSGKTEAGILLAHRILKGGYAGGLFFALPTMASSNAILNRLQKLPEQIFASPSSFVLNHSGSYSYRQALARDGTQRMPLRETLSSSGNAWLTQASKRALLANIGVGTVDQALMAGIKTKHAALRGLSLFRNVLIVDEVHSYDPYMIEILKNLLTYQYRTQSHVILMSATLSRQISSMLERTYTPTPKRGKTIFAAPKVPATPEKELPAFPLATCVSPSGVQRTPCQDGKRKTVRVTTTTNHLAPIQACLQAYKEGKAVCYIRNTVAAATEAYKVVKRRCPGARVILFHSRFTVKRRQEIEALLERRFGKGSRPEDRNVILVATQVVESSLDLDFDFMASDLTFIDLLIQRMGRLHRHKRDYRTGDAHFMLLIPDPNNVTETWMRDFFDHFEELIYRNHGQLWLTAKWFLENNQFNTPEHNRSAIEAVYRVEYLEDVPAALQKVSLKAEGSDAGDASQASLITIPYRQGYAGQWRDDEPKTTRIGIVTKPLRLVKKGGGGLVPLYEDNWENSVVTVPQSTSLDLVDQSLKQLQDRMLQDEFDAKIKYRPAPLPLTEWNGVWQVTVLVRDEPVLLTYDEEFGFRAQKRC
ncbi:MAG: CRISPR-associated helicase Cas3' [Thermodesulfovibrionales bacterium]